jgi:hypothetical protein
MTNFRACRVFRVISVSKAHAREHTLKKEKNTEYSEYMEDGSRCERMNTQERGRYGMNDESEGTHGAAGGDAT